MECTTINDWMANGMMVYPKYAIGINLVIFVSQEIRLMALLVVMYIVTCNCITCWLLKPWVKHNDNDCGPPNCIELI